MLLLRSSIPFQDLRSLLKICRNPEERDKWLMLRRFPHLLDATSLNEISVAQANSIRLHELLDAGSIQQCEKCNGISVESAEGMPPKFCEECGASLNDAR